jgi:molybdopterin-guanine dinucleotide biosynthesis protein B
MSSARVLGLVGWSGSGKTTLITKLIPLLVNRGMRVATLKHAHHAFDVDQPGKDSYVHRMAGATEVLVSSQNRIALMHELRGAPELTLAALLGKLMPVDLVIIEGYKRDPHPKLEVFRASVGKPLIHPQDPHVVAIASDVPLPQVTVPRVALDDIDAIADLMLARAAAPVAAAEQMAEENAAQDVCPHCGSLVSYSAASRAAAPKDHEMVALLGREA